MSTRSSVNRKAWLPLYLAMFATTLGAGGCKIKALENGDYMQVYQDPPGQPVDPVPAVHKCQPPRKEAIEGPFHRLEPGNWAGADADLIVGDHSLGFQFSCASAFADGDTLVDSCGDFTREGTYTPSTGAVPICWRPTTYHVHIEGKISGAKEDEMTVVITFLAVEPSVELSGRYCPIQDPLPSGTSDPLSPPPIALPEPIHLKLRRGDLSHELMRCL